MAGIVETLNKNNILAYGLRDKDGASEEQVKKWKQKYIFTWKESDIESELLQSDILYSFLNCNKKSDAIISREEFDIWLKLKINTLTEVEGWKKEFLSSKIKSKILNTTEIKDVDWNRIMLDILDYCNTKTVSQRARGKDKLHQILKEANDKWNNLWKGETHLSLNSWLSHLNKCKTGKCVPDTLKMLKNEIQSQITND